MRSLLYYVLWCYVVCIAFNPFFFGCYLLLLSVWCDCRRFEKAALLTAEEQRRSKSYSDQVIAWVIETVSGTLPALLYIHYCGGSAAAVCS